jgi:glycosyltransferase involved in cell wall biosynthesis
MRILMLSWEYPPRIVGGIARHVQELSEALAQLGGEVHVITAAHPQAPAEAVENGVMLHRVGVPFTPSPATLLEQVYALNAAIESRAEPLLSEWLRSGKRRPILIHAHDWLVEPAARALKHHFKLPLIATIHATEHGRHGGLHTDLSRTISHHEWQLSYEAWRVIVCSHFMRDEVHHILSVPYDKLDVIPNGIRAEKFAFEFPQQERAAFRTRFALPDQPLILFVGRLVREKGIHVLLQAMPMVKAYVPNAKLVIVGGGWRAHLEGFARFLRMESSVCFTGFIPDEELLRLYRVVDVAVYPSLYEPFGIVALEAMAVGVPVVVSDAGGLKEVVQHERTGLITWAGNAESLAWGILRVLQEPRSARQRAERARRAVQRQFNWARIARQTRQLYRLVWQQYRQSGW